MSKRLTYLDACVLINAWRAEDLNLRNQARALLYDPGREFVGCRMLDLELVPKPWFNGYHPEHTFMRNFCHGLHVKVSIDENLIEDAIHIGGRHGVSGGDAIHVAAAIKGGAMEFVTSEKESHAFYRVPDLTITHTMKAQVVG